MANQKKGVIVTITAIEQTIAIGIMDIIAKLKIFLFRPSSEIISVQNNIVAKSIAFNIINAKFLDELGV